MEREEIETKVQYRNGEVKIHSDKNGSQKNTYSKTTFQGKKGIYTQKLSSRHQETRMFEVGIMFIFLLLPLFFKFSTLGIYCLNKNRLFYLRNKP